MEHLPRWGGIEAISLLNSERGQFILQGPSDLPADEILPSCKQLFPAFMAASLASWESRMESTYVSVFGEAAPCIL